MMAWNPTPNGASGGPTTLAQAGELLRDGRVSEAFTAYQLAAQSAPNDPAPLLGLAESYLAMGNLPQARTTAEQARTLAPGQPLALLAQAIAQTAAGDTPGALSAIDSYVATQPGPPYAYALRGYLLRQVGQRYEAELARARAARAWGTRDFAHLFPPEDTTPSTPQQQPQQPTANLPLPNGGAYTPQRPWNERSQLERRVTRARFATRGVPVATYTLIGINIAIYLLCALVSLNLFAPINGLLVNRATGVFVGTVDPANPIYNFGVEQGLLITHQPWQVYRIFTAMFLHESIIHIGLNMLSLYFVGVITEQFFGARRWLIIYFASGILAGAAQAIVAPGDVSLGASGAIFGIFGAFGAFAFLRRRSFGPAGNSILGQWLFWLAINFAFDLRAADIATWAHVGGLIAGILIGFIMLQRPTRALPGR